MKLAVLIMMHKNPSQVLRLIKWYKSEDVYFFVHVDKKAQIEIAQFESELHAVSKNAMIVPWRNSCYLYSWSLVQGELALAEYARKFAENNGFRFDYYQNISGQDYPITKYEKFEQILNSGGKSVYLNMCSRSSTGDIPNQFKRTRYYKIRRVFDDYIKFEPMRKICVGFVHIYELFLDRFIGSPAKRLIKLGYEMGFGAAWWILPCDIIDKALELEKENCNKSEKQLIKIMRNTGLPEETYFQTVYLNFGSEFKLQSNMTYCNFGTRGRVNTGHPYDFEIADLPELLEKSKSNCFARKFNIETDADILDEMDKINGMRQ